MKLLELLLEITSDELLNNWLNKGLITNEDIDLINKVTTNQNYRKWLGNLVKNQVLKTEEILKFKDYLDLFTKYPNTYSIKDVNLIKTKEDLDNFKNISIRLMDLNKENDSYLNPNEIMNLEEAGINYMGTVEGFQLFIVPQDLIDDTNAYKKYKNILGKCSGGEINICTIGGIDHFNDFLIRDDLYVLYNHSLSQSPYQIHFESLSFLDRSNKSANKSLSDDVIFNICDFIFREEGRPYSYNMAYMLKFSLQTPTYITQKLDKTKKEELINGLLKKNLILHDFGFTLNDLTNNQKRFFIKKVLDDFKDSYQRIMDWGINVNDLTPEEKSRYIDIFIQRRPFNNYSINYYGLSINDLNTNQKFAYILKVLMFTNFNFNDNEYQIKLSDLQKQHMDYLLKTIEKNRFILTKIGLTDKEQNYLKTLLPQ